MLSTVAISRMPFLPGWYHILGALSARLFGKL